MPFMPWTMLMFMLSLLKILNYTRLPSSVLLHCRNSGLSKGSALCFTVLAHSRLERKSDRKSNWGLCPSRALGLATPLPKTNVNIHIMAKYHLIMPFCPSSQKLVFSAASSSHAKRLILIKECSSHSGSINYCAFIYEKIYPQTPYITHKLLSYTAPSVPHLSQTHK